MQLQFQELPDKKEFVKGYSNTNSNMHFHVQFYFK